MGFFKKKQMTPEEYDEKIKQMKVEQQQRELLKEKQAQLDQLRKAKFESSGAGKIAKGAMGAFSGIAKLGSNAGKMFEPPKSSSKKKKNVSPFANPFMEQPKKKKKKQSNPFDMRWD